MSQKKVSATAWGVLECARRYLMETFLGARRPQKERDRGIAFHLALEGIGKLRLKGVDVGPDECRKIVAALNLEDPFLSAEVLKSALWWAERMVGVIPIAVEENGGRWAMVIADVEYGGKYDLVFLNQEKNGRVTVVDYKSGFTPDKEAAKRTIQNVMYAKSAMETFGVDVVDVMIVNLSERFAYIVTFYRNGATTHKDDMDVDLVWSFMAQDAKVIERRHRMIEEAKATEADKDGKLEGLLDDEEFKPRINAWCDKCPVKRTCSEYAALVWMPDPVLTGFDSRPAAVMALRERAKIVDKAKERMEKDLKADAAGAGVVTEGGYTVTLKTTTFKTEPKPAGEQTQTRLIIERGA